MVVLATVCVQTQAADADYAPPQRQAADPYYKEPHVFGMLPDSSAKKEKELGPIGVTGIVATIQPGVRVTVEGTQPGTPAEGKFNKGGRSWAWTRISETSMRHSAIILAACMAASAAQGGLLEHLSERLHLEVPEHGFVSGQPASKWDESLICGNGTIGLTMTGDALKDRIIFSHVELFLPRYPPTAAPDLRSRLDEIRELVRKGDGETASVMAVEEGRKVGIPGMIWPNPPVPACQLELEALDTDAVTAHARRTEFQTGEILVFEDIRLSRSLPLGGGDALRRKLDAIGPDYAVLLATTPPSTRRCSIASASNWVTAPSPPGHRRSCWRPRVSRTRIRTPSCRSSKPVATTSAKEDDRFRITNQNCTGQGVVVRGRRTGAELKGGRGMGINFVYVYGIVAPGGWRCAAGGRLRS
jgi:hypothetical protein